VAFMATDVVVLRFGEPGIFTSSLVNGAVNGAAETQWPNGQTVAIEVMTDFVQQSMEAHVPPGPHAPPHQRISEYVQGHQQRMRCCN
jgi:uncharacterized protein YodC (DUF2158 family)